MSRATLYVYTSRQTLWNMMDGLTSLDCIEEIRISRYSNDINSITLKSGRVITLILARNIEDVRARICGRSFDEVTYLDDDISDDIKKEIDNRLKL